MKFHKLLVGDKVWRKLAAYYDENYREINAKHGFTNMYAFCVMLLESGFKEYKDKNA